MIQYFDYISLGMLGELEIDINEGMQIELQGHLGRFQVNNYDDSICFVIIICIKS